ncbi:MAG: hypothetical protein ABIP41_06150 [Croceibacterium sp.]
MDFDDLLRHHFGTSQISQVTPAVLAAGIERLLVDFGLEQDRGKRFALWALLYLLSAAPDLDVAFKDPSDREAARNFMDLAAAAEDE